MIRDMIIFCLGGIAMLVSILGVQEYRRKYSPILEPPLQVQVLDDGGANLKVQTCVEQETKPKSK
jgi:hypothetical protein